MKTLSLWIYFLQCAAVLLSSAAVLQGTSVVNVNQTSYQAEENQNITLEWTFTTKPDSSLAVFCEQLTELRISVLFDLYGGAVTQDEHFAGRVQWDKDVLREGRLRLHVSRLRTEDSGVYLCKVFINHEMNSGKCFLNVTAAKARPQQVTPNTTIEEKSPVGIVLYCGLGLAAAALLGVCLCLFMHLRKGAQDSSTYRRPVGQRLIATFQNGKRDSCSDSSGIGSAASSAHGSLVTVSTTDQN